MESTVARQITTLVVGAAAASVLAAGAVATVHGITTRSDRVAHVEAVQVGPVHPLVPELLPKDGPMPAAYLTPSSTTPPPTLSAVEHELRVLLAPDQRGPVYNGVIHIAPLPKLILPHSGPAELTD